MPRLVHKLPSYRLHKPSGQAVVTLGGKDVYLGPHNTKTSRAEYDRVVAEWLTNGRRPPAATPVDAAALTVSEMILRYWVFARGHYRRDGRPTRELDNIRDALRPVRALYGHTPATQFGPLALKAARRGMIDAGLARTTINFRVSKIRRAFKWAAENELIVPEVYQGLMTVTGLLRGRDDVRETGPVKTIPEAHIAAVLPHVSGPVRAMIELQDLTGMRPGEVTSMRGVDIDRAGDVWVYRPAGHKTQNHGHDRVIILGPRAQTVLRPWLGDDPAGKPARTPKRPPRARYDKNAYGQAIARACKKAGVPHWHPNQLRHNAATRVRRRYGIEAARQVLGHRSAAVSEVYAEADLQKVLEIMGEIG